MLSFESEFTRLMGDLWALSQSVDVPYLRRQLGKALTANVPKFGNSALNPSGNPLWSEGVFPLGPLAQGLNLPEVLAQLSNCRLYDIQDLNDPVPLIDEDEFLLSERPGNVFLAAFKFEDLARCTALVKLACDPAIVDIVRACIGCTPTISGFQAWYTFPGCPAEMFHRNLVDFHSIRLFVYLTDVGPEDGPHQFIPFTHRIETLEQYFRSTGKTVDVRSLFQGNSRNLVMADVEGHFGEEIMTITGPAGFAFLENTYGLHREMRPGSSPRLMFSVIYTGLPLRYANENVRRYEMSRRVSFAEAGLDSASDVERYMLRYYLRE